MRGLIPRKIGYEEHQDHEQTKDQSYCGGRDHKERHTKIHVVAADPFFPSTKSIGGPRAFSNMNILKLLLTSVNTQNPLLIIMKTAAIAIQNISTEDSRLNVSPHSLVASVSIVPRIAKTPIIAPRIKNQIPESNTPSNTGRTLEITGRSLSGNNMPYSIRKIIVETKPIASITHEEEGSASPWRNSPTKEFSLSSKTSPRNHTIPNRPPEIYP